MESDGRHSLMGLFAFVPREKEGSVRSRSSLSSYLCLSVTPGHFKQLPEEKGCLERHRPRASFRRILQGEGGGVEQKWEVASPKLSNMPPE